MSTLRGMRKYSTVRARAKLFGGMITDSPLIVDEVFLVKLFWIDDRAVDVGEEFELVGAANVVAVTRRSVRNDSLAVNFFDLAGLVRLDHPYSLAIMRIHLSDLMLMLFLKQHYTIHDAKNSEMFYCAAFRYSPFHHQL